MTSRGGAVSYLPRTEASWPDPRGGYPRHAADRPEHAATARPGEPVWAGHAPDVSVSGWAEAGQSAVSPWVRALPDLRNQVVNRLHAMSWEHARQAWARRRRDPLGAHAVALLYAEAPGTGRVDTCELHVAVRLFLDERLTLPMLLYELGDVARDLLADGADPRNVLANWHEPMSPDAAYIGLGVSTLDTPAGTWAQAQRGAHSDLDIPGRCYALLFDGTRLLVDRHARHDFGQVHVWSTRRLHDASGQPLRDWDLGPHLLDPRQQDQYSREVWQWLSHLHHVIAGGAREY